MRLSKFSKKLIAYLCAIAMVVSSFVFTPSTDVKAAKSATVDGITYTVTDGAQGDWTGIETQGIFDKARIHFAWGKQVDDSSIAVKVDGKDVTAGGTNPYGVFITIADVNAAVNNELGEYTIQITAVSSDSEQLMWTADLKMEEAAPTTTRDPSVFEWVDIVNSDGLQYDDRTLTKVDTFQNPGWPDQKEAGVYVLQPDGAGAPTKVTIDGVEVTTGANGDFGTFYQMGAGLLFYGSTFANEITNIVINYAGEYGDATLVIKNTKVSPTEETTEAPTEETTEEPTVEPTTEAPTVEPTTEEPTEEPTTEEPTTKEQKPQDYYDGWVDTERNLALKGTASDTGAHREGSIKQINDAVIDKFDNWDAITVNEDHEYGTFNIKLDKAYDAASIDQIVVYWRTADVQFVPQAGYKVQFGYNGVFTTVATLTHDDYPTEGTVGGWPDVTDECRFVTDSDFTTDRLESKGVDTIRILVDTPVEWGAQVREICVFSENPQDAPPLPQADDPDDITAYSPNYGTIAYTVTPGEGQENYKYNVYAGEVLIGEGLDGNQEYIAYGFDPGDYTLRAVSVVEGMDPSDGIYSDTVTVADPIELIDSTKNKAPEGEIISVSSFYNENYDLDTSQCAIDGTPVAGEGNTECLRTGAHQQPATIDIDLGKQYNKKDLQAIVLAYTNPRTYAADTVVGVSDDGETYYSVADQRYFSVEKDGQLTANLISANVVDDEGTFRYVRINLSSGVNDWGYVVNQIGVIIDDGEEPTTEEPTTEEPTTEEPTTEAPTEAPTQVPGEWTSLTPENFVVTEEIVEEGQVTGRWFQVSGYEVYLGYWDNASGQAMIDADDQDNIKFQQLSSNWYGEWGTQVRKTLTGLIPGEEYTLTMNMNASAADGTYKTSQDDTSYPVQEGDQTITIKGKADQDGNISFTVGTGLVGTAVVMTFSDVIVKDDMGYQVYPKVEPTTEAPTETQTEEPSTEAPTETQTEEPSTEAPTETQTEQPSTEAPTETQTAKPTETAKPGPGPATTAKPAPAPTTAKPKPAKPGKTKVKKAVKKKKSAKKIKVKLKKVKGAKGYQVAVYKSKKKAKKNKKALVKKYYKKTKFTIKSKKFKNKKKLWVKARAFVMYGKSKIFGKWSKPKKTKKK